MTIVRTIEVVIKNENHQENYRMLAEQLQEKILEIEIAENLSCISIIKLDRRCDPILQGYSTSFTRNFLVAFTKKTGFFGTFMEKFHLRKLG